MRTSVKIFPDISRSELATPENLVRFGLSFMRELAICSAGVDQERGFSRSAVFLDGPEFNELDINKQTNTTSPPRGHQES
jgi:hypothetical protein